MTHAFSYPSFMPPENDQTVIAVTNHMTSFGDVLFSVPVAREYARRHNAKVDFWLGGGGTASYDLIAAQKFVRRIIRDPEHHPHNWHFEKPYDLRHGYTAIYEVGYRSGFQCTIPQYYERQANMPSLPIRFDLPDGYEGRPLPDGKFIAIANKNHDPICGLKIYREFVRHSPLPVVEVGYPGETAATDLGALDRTSHGFLEMAWVLSKCYCYFGCPNSPYVIATGFPCLKIIMYYAYLPPDQNHLVKSPLHIYMPRHHGQMLHDDNPNKFFQWAMPELYGMAPRSPTIEIMPEPDVNSCICPSPGFCPRYKRGMYGRLHEICSGTALGREQTVMYRKSWLSQVS